MIYITLGQQFRSNLEIFRLEIQNASTTSSKSNQLRNVNTLRWESGNVTTQPWEITDRKSEVISFECNINCVRLNKMSYFSEFLSWIIQTFWKWWTTRDQTIDSYKEISFFGKICCFKIPIFHTWSNDHIQFSERSNKYSRGYGILKSYAIGITLCCIEMIEKNSVPIGYDFKSQPDRGVRVIEKNAFSAFLHQFFCILHLRCHITKNIYKIVLRFGPHNGYCH